MGLVHESASYAGTVSRRVGLVASRVESGVLAPVGGCEGAVMCLGVEPCPCEHTGGVFGVRSDVRPPVDLGYVAAPLGHSWKTHPLGRIFFDSPCCVTSAV